MAEKIEQCTENCDMLPIAKKFTLVGESDCPNCTIAKDLLTRDGKMDKINYVDENHPDFANLVDKHNINAFPTFITPDNKVCSLFGTHEEYHLDCKDGTKADI